MAKISDERKFFRPDAMIRLREEMGWTQAECGERAGFGQSRWADIEAGKYDNLSLATFAGICRALDVDDPAELLVDFRLTGPAIEARRAPKGGGKAKKAVKSE